jgi:hypothetical protein
MEILMSKHEHDHHRSEAVIGNIQFEHEDKQYEFPGEAAPFVGHDGDSAVQLPESGDMLTIHLDKSKPPNVMHVHLADSSEEEIFESGGKIWHAKLAN